MQVGIGGDATTRTIAVQRSVQLGVYSVMNGILYFVPMLVLE